MSPITFTAPETLATVNLSITLASCVGNGWQVAFKNFTLNSIGGEQAQLQNLYSTMQTSNYKTSTTENNSILWRAQSTNSSSIETFLFNETAFIGTNSNNINNKSAPTIGPKVGSSQGLVLYDHFHTTTSDDPFFIKIVDDTDTYLTNAITDGGLGFTTNQVIAITSTNHDFSPTGYPSKRFIVPRNNQEYRNRYRTKWCLS